MLYIVMYCITNHLLSGMKKKNQPKPCIPVHHSKKKVTVLYRETGKPYPDSDNTSGGWLGAATHVSDH